jgi:hypothetical protein
MLHPIGAASSGKSQNSSLGSFFVLGGSVYGVAMVRDRPVKFMMVGELKDRLDELLERKKMSRRTPSRG